MMMSFLLCNNVTPIEEESGRMLQAASPDEVSLVQFAESMDFVMKKRNIDSILLEDPTGNQREFTIMKNFPFSSETKVNLMFYIFKINVMLFY